MMWTMMMIGSVERMNCVSVGFVLRQHVYTCYSLIWNLHEEVFDRVFFSHLFFIFLPSLLQFFPYQLCLRSYTNVHIHIYILTVAVLPLLDQSEFSHVSFFFQFHYFVRVSIVFKLFIFISTDWFIFPFISFGSWYA